MNRRPLKKIAAEIATILKREVESRIEIGGLLAEAKEQLDEHGQWLPWLSENFSFSSRTAERYMAAHALAAKFDTVSNLGLLTVSGLHALVEADHAGHSEAVERALSEAKVKRIDDTRVWAIVAELRPRLQPEPPSDEGGDEDGDEGEDEDPSSDEAGDEAEPPDEAAEEPEPDAGDDDEEPEPEDDRPPPTPPPSLTPKQVAQLLKFETAAKELLGLVAKPAREFLAAGVSDFDLETTADFLRQVLREREKLKVAAGDQGGGDVAQAVKAG